MSDLPTPDTASLAMSGRSVDYISGYERGYEAAAEQVRAAILAERERCIRIAEGDYEHLTVGIDPHASVGRMIAAAIRRGSV